MLPLVNGNLKVSASNMNAYLAIVCIGVIMIFVFPWEAHRCCRAQIIGRGSYALYTKVISTLLVAY